MKLLNTTAENKILIDDLKIAETFWARTKGLLGRESLPENEALWILRCNSIHTYFMKFPIDVVFVDKKMVVVDIGTVKPGKLVLPVWRARSVIEFKAGFVEKNKINKGDVLHVDRTLP
jgi:uncharacterized membrane protein (UPF0127 family)